MFERGGLILLCCVALTARAEMAGLLHDPTRPNGWQPAHANEAFAAAEHDKTLRLHGVFSNADARTAMINGQRVAIGDRVGDARVMEIQQNKVTLHQGDETIELVVGVAAVKSPALRKEVRR